MEEKNQSDSTDGGKPFSILDQFRQLKKDNEDPTASENNQNAQSSQSQKTVFQNTTSPVSHEKFIGRRGNRGRRRCQDSNDRESYANNRLHMPMHEGQMEVDVGITEFLRSGPGFDAIIKHRFTDFHVNEIDLDGNIVKLTTTEIPVDKEPENKIDESLTDTPLTVQQWEKLQEIADKELSEEFVEIDVTEADKNTRQNIHKAIKARFGVHIYSNTNEEGDKKIMKIGWATNTTRGCRWPKGRPEYLHFVLQKENVDMSEAINILARKTLLKSSKFGFSGTKDKRGVTVQKVSVRRGDAMRLKQCFYRGLSLGNYSYHHKGLRLGDLNGNRFKIALRNVKVDDDVIENAANELKKNGFINYFGMQRFGQSRVVPTHFIGKAILKNDWKLATELVLKPRPGEDRFKDLSEAKTVYDKTKDASEALKCLRFKEKSIEGKILCGLKKNGPNAYQNAFDELPRQTVSLYLHAYQSLLWNKIVSRRIKTFGLKVLPGDLVKEDIENEDLDKDNSQSDCEDETENRIRLEEDTDEGWTCRALSEEEARCASVREICYPLPGANIRMPANEIEQWYNELLAEDGFTMDSFKQVHKKYGMHGAYRHMLECAEDLTWRIVRYSHSDQDLVVSDADLLRGKEPFTSEPDGPYKAVIFEFSLNVCSYATMALRELTKSDTSSHNQAKLTKEAYEEDIVNKRKIEEQNNVDRKKMKPEGEATSPTVSESEHKQNTTCEMEVDSLEETNTTLLPEKIVENESQEQEEDEFGERNRREADADNIINKYLDKNYH